MYLTKLMLNARDCTHFQIRDAYAVHKLVYSLFPVIHDTNRQRILYADKGTDQGYRFLLIQSQAQPHAPVSLAMTTLCIGDSFWASDRYYFEAVLNPVKRNPATGKRQPVKGLFPVMKWLVENSLEWGFSADEQTLQAFIQNTLTFEKGGKEYCFNRVLFRGSLTVTERAPFRSAVEKGLGHGKAFGFGLLQLSPIV
ncbi:type I-E CRISPR-associated protein Cas6/Cse3/CasE [Oligosphaera ethanolica]|uniref:CRISPR system Cascade subunit CasE n=1 Tax=Oligosphaera ethanolica TaxID=760260 RepID=A0AAE3VDE4_9BACT|nr:type I-E CRISPR-associated protein Cas6/Cse3/CasE [Oligosphaera ethanolica]MDQ0288263.1 CRISPR system Cascade subunit CasE [Oligosphaera ethanolica]